LQFLHSIGTKQFYTTIIIRRIIRQMGLIIYPTVNGQSHRTITTTWPSNILRYVQLL